MQMRISASYLILFFPRLDDKQDPMPTCNAVVGRNAAVPLLTSAIRKCGNVMHVAQVSIDTACSSALVGVHMAMQHLQAHAGSALSAGINLMLAEHTTAATQVAGMLSPEGRCKTLDAAADGYVRAEACVVLRLDAVEAGGFAANGSIIKGTCVNQVCQIFKRVSFCTQQLGRHNSQLMLQ